MEFLYLLVVMVMVTSVLGQSTQKIQCPLDDDMACLRAELSASKLAVDKLLMKVKELESDNADLQDKLKRCSQPVVPSCPQPSGSEKWLSGGRKTNTPYSEVITAVQQRNNRNDLYVLERFVNKMFIINGELWVPNLHNYTILILDPNMYLIIREINFTNVAYYMNTYSLHQTATNEVLLASTRGLYVFDLYGSYLYKVAGGVIYDMVMDCNKAYVYNASNNNIATVSHSGGQWVVTNTFNASRSGIGENTIMLLNNLLYLTTIRRSTIQGYNMTGTYINTYGVYGKNSSSGFLGSPYLCGRDSQVLLVCDRYNDRLQLLSPGGTWQVYILQGVTLLEDAIVDTSGNMWVMWFDRKLAMNRISKFSV